MPDPGSGQSRLCPACGRRVPRAVATCRCGEKLPEMGDVPVADAPAHTGLTAGNFLVFAGLLAAVGAAGYWALATPPTTAAVAPMNAPAIAEGGMLRPPPETRAGVVPGVMRDALATSRLEFDGWDR